MNMIYISEKVFKYLLVFWVSEREKDGAFSTCFTVDHLGLAQLRCMFKTRGNQPHSYPLWAFILKLSNICKCLIEEVDNKKRGIENKCWSETLEFFD